jgi:hypothetical protein
MNFKNLGEEQKKELTKLLFDHLNTPEELQNWIFVFFGLWFPYGTVDPESTSSPLHAIWTAYEIYKFNKGSETAGLIICSCRAGIKTLAVAIFEVLSILHFNITIAHMSSLESQSGISLKYIEGFFRSIAPLMECRGWKNTSQNKRTIEYMNDKDETVFIKVIIATKAGANSAHTNCLALDELDLCPEDVIAESSFIPVYSKGIYPIKIFLSSLKWSFGPMIKAMETAEEKKYKILKWNVIDVTEKCQESRHLPDLPKEDRYIYKDLPLKQISVKDYEMLSEAEQAKFSLIKDAHAGCAKCPLLPVCKMGLSKRPKEDVGGLFKPIDATIQQFLESSPELASSQLLCLRPGSEGLVYPRFSKNTKDGNVISIKDAFETIVGTPAPPNIAENTIYGLLRSLDIPIYCGVDWGFTHEAVIMAMAKIPNGEVWVIDCFASPKLEIQDLLPIAISFRDKYKPIKWYCDQAMPAYIKAFNRNGMSSPKFQKDVSGGIGAVRSKVMNGMGQRLLKILDVDNNKKVISSILKHKFLLDSQQNVTSTPDDEPGISDICDTLRYLGQNMFPVSGPQRPNISMMDPSLSQLSAVQKHTPEQHEMMQRELAKAIGGPVSTGSSGKRGGFHYSF